MNNNELENLSGQTIKELIGKNEITIEELGTSALYELLDYETELLETGSGDMELIRKCGELLDKANGVPLMSEEEVREVLARTQEKYVRIVPDTPRKVIGVKNIFKRVAVVAAAVAVLTAGSVAIAGSFGVDVLGYFRDIISKPTDSKIEVDNVTFHNVGETKKYSSVEELVGSENLDIMYPSEMPEGFEIVNVVLSKTINGNDSIIFYTNDSNVNVQIELGANIPSTDNTNKFKYNGMTYYIQEKENIVLSYSYYKGNKYYIVANTRDDLIYIINNLKE